MKLLPPTSYGVPGGLERRLPGTVAVRHRPEARSPKHHSTRGPTFARLRLPSREILPYPVPAAT